MSWRLRWRRGVSLETLPLLAVATAAIALAIAAAYLLPVWQWDALGYHLPYVNFALQRGTFADIPDDVAYLSTYPHIVEYAFIAWRALLPDDRLVELAHLPFGLLGALAIATIARRQGARTDHAVAAGVAWLTFPAVFLQLPTNYTDVASAALLLTAAAFVLGPMDRTRILLAAAGPGVSALTCSSVRYISESSFEGSPAGRKFVVIGSTFTSGSFTTFCKSAKNFGMSSSGSARTSKVASATEGITLGPTPAFRIVGTIEVRSIE
jgi:hypothetical protein